MDLNRKFHALTVMAPHRRKQLNGLLCVFCREENYCVNVNIERRKMLFYARGVF